MAQQSARYIATQPASLAEGWTLEQLTPPSRLYGANGIRTAPDGRIYVAQVSGSQISAVDIETGLVEAISPMGGEIVAPDDLDFDSQGNIYATEITEGRVSVRAPNGKTRVVNGDMPSANPITIHKGRLFAGECRPGGRIMELDLNTGEQRIILDNVPMPNAMEVGPDGMLYFPLMGTNEIWRISLDGGEPEVVARDLGVPDAVKFDSKGRIVSTQVGSGEVLRIDPASGEREVLASIAPGLDNLAFVGDRLFVSSISGQINEVLPGGELRSVVPDGLQFPLGLAVDENNTLFVADGGFTHTLKPGGSLQTVGMLFSPGFPGYTRGVAVFGPGEYLVTTANGQVARWNPAKQESEVIVDGFERLYGVALAGDGTIFFADANAENSATGRVYANKGGKTEMLLDGLREPMGVALTADGGVLVAEERGGRVLRIDGSRADTVLDGLQQPQGILVREDVLYVVDAGAKELVAYNLSSNTRGTIASDLPVGAPPGVVPKFLRAIPPLSGPMGPFAGIAAGPDGTLYLSADADGSVIALREES